MLKDKNRGIQGFLQSKREVSRSTSLFVWSLWIVGKCHRGMRRSMSERASRLLTLCQNRKNSRKKTKLESDHRKKQKLESHAWLAVFHLCTLHLVQYFLLNQTKISVNFHFPRLFAKCYNHRCLLSNSQLKTLFQCRKHSWLCRRSPGMHWSRAFISELLRMKVATSWAA